MANGEGSAVVEVMQKASRDSWKKWREHVAAGTADTEEALAAFDNANLAAATWIGEVAAREQAREKVASPRAA